MRGVARSNHIDKRPTDIDWARLAAYIDGEGCICIGQKRVLNGPERKCTSTRTYLNIIIANTDPRLSEWLRDTFGGSIQLHRPHKNNPKWSLGYHWITGNRQAKWVLEGCLPFFIMKRAQAEIGIAHQNLCDYGKSAETFEKRTALRDKLSSMKGLASRRRIIPIRSEMTQEVVA